MNRITSILYILFLILVLSLYTGCNPVTEDQGPVIFDDVERIELDGYSGGTFYFGVPKGISIVVLGLFDAEIETQNQTILNEGNFFGGTRTGLDGYVKGMVDSDKLYYYDDTLNDFDSSSFILSITSGTYWWAVWGYDANGNLTHASEQISVSL